MHYHFEDVFLKTGKRELIYRIDEYEKEVNQTNFKVLLIDKIRADLFEILFWKWRGQNFKWSILMVLLKDNGALIISLLKKVWVELQLMLDSSLQPIILEG